MERMRTERVTWEDVLAMPEDGNRYEAIAGVLYVTPAPSLRHQWISFNLARALGRLLVDSGHGYVLCAPVAVEFPLTEEGVQPDIIFLSKARTERMVEEGIRGAPDLVVEILSPATAPRDGGIKKDLYERQGVAVYWIVDPEAECVDVWDSAAGATAAKRHTNQMPVRIGGLSAGSMSLPEIFPPELEAR